MADSESLEVIFFSAAAACPAIAAMGVRMAQTGMNSGYTPLALYGGLMAVFGTLGSVLSVAGYFREDLRPFTASGHTCSAVTSLVLSANPDLL